jgi:hypothetical protein
VTLRCDVVGRVMMFTLMHPINLASSYPYLHWADLGAGRAVRQEGHAHAFPGGAGPIVSSRYGWVARWC